MTQFKIKYVANLPLWVLIAAFAISTSWSDLADDFSAAGWFQYGMVGHSSDTSSGQDFNNKGSIVSGAQFLIHKEISEQFLINAGIGVASFHFIASSLSSSGGYSPMNSFPYVAEANFRYNIINDEDSKLFIRGGLLPFDYSENNRNLGLYLLRGPVYPGYIYSGFETKHVLPVANILGLHFGQQIGSFSHDLIFSSETELYPYFDISPAYLARVNVGDVFEIGAGVNFYHFISIEDSLTNYPQGGLHVDTIPDGLGGTKLDSAYISFRGIKLMANASFDIKPLLGLDDLLGPEDLKLYGEVALIGIDNSERYKKIFGGYGERMPIMVGFNLPVFNLLNHLSLEFEWYKAKFRDNLDGFMTTASNWPSSIPYDESFLPPWEDRDNLKWSLHGEKFIANHVKFSFQLANDHWRPGAFTGYGDNNLPLRNAIMMTPKDWYWMTKFAFFF